MKETIALFCLAMGLMSATPKDPVEKHLVLPNPELIRRCSVACTSLWDGNSGGREDIFPSQLIIDVAGQDCPRGVVALYDSSVALADVKRALDQRYGKWANAENSKRQVKIWRVEPENLAIQLAEVDSDSDLSILGRSSSTRSDDRETTKKELKQVIYLPISGSKCDCRTASVPESFSPRGS